MEGAGESRRTVDGDDDSSSVVMLWDVYRRHECQDARDRLFYFYSPFCKKIALSVFVKVSSLGVDRDDVFQYASMGLVCAIANFVPSKGVPFEAYAVYRIRGSIYSGLSSYSELLSLLDFRKKLEAERNKALVASVGDIQDADKLLDLTLSLVISACIESIHTLEPEHPERFSYVDRSADEWLSGRLWKIIGELPERLSTVILLHYAHEMSFDEISKKIGVSKTRVSQLLAVSISEIRKKMKVVVYDR